MGRRYPHAGRQEVHVRLHLVADVAQHKGERAHHQHKDAAVQEPPLAQVCRPLSGVAQKEHGGHQHHRPIGAPAERSHKEHDNQANGPQPPAGKPLPVQHEDEPGVHQGAAGLALANNHQHGYANDEHHRPEVLPARNAEVLLAHYVGQQERGRYLGNLCRLEADGPQVEPRMGALDVGRYKDDQHQQPQHGHVERNAAGLPHARRNQVQDGPCQPQRGKNPHKLLPGAGAPGKQGPRLRAMRGGVNIEPANKYQHQVRADKPPVHGLPGMGAPLSHVLRGPSGWFPSFSFPAPAGMFCP